MSNIILALALALFSAFVPAQQDSFSIVIETVDHVVAEAGSDIPATPATTSVAIVVVPLWRRHFTLVLEAVADLSKGPDWLRAIHRAVITTVTGALNSRWFHSDYLISSNWIPVLLAVFGVLLLTTAPGGGAVMAAIIPAHTTWSYFVETIAKAGVINLTKYEHETIKLKLPKKLEGDARNKAERIRDYVEGLHEQLHGCSFPFVKSQDELQLHTVEIDGVKVKNGDWEALGLVVSAKANAHKLGKYVGRVFRKAQKGFAAPGNLIAIGAPTPASDGKFLATPGEARKLGVPRRLAKVGNRFSVTLVWPEGFFKGHMIIISRKEMKTIREPGTPTIPSTEVRHEFRSLGFTYTTFDVVKRSHKARLDNQSLVNLLPFYEPEEFRRWFGLMLDTNVKRLLDGDLSAWDRFKDTDFSKPLALDKLKSWSLGYAGSMRADFMSATWVRQMVSAIDQETKPKMTEEDTLGLRKTLVPGGFRAYYATDEANLYTSAERPYVLRGATFWAHTSVSEAICAVLGGMDEDDPMNITPIDDGTQDDESVTIVAIRNPNQWAEVFGPKTLYHYGEVDLDTVVARLRPDYKDWTPRTYRSNREATLKDVLHQEESFVMESMADPTETLKADTTVKEWAKLMEVLMQDKLRTDASIGVAGHATFTTGQLAWVDMAYFDEFMKEHSFNYETIIDAVNRGDVDATVEMEVVKSIPGDLAFIAEVFKNRVPQQLRGEIDIWPEHPLDELAKKLEAMFRTVELKINGYENADRSREHGYIDYLVKNKIDAGMFTLFGKSVYSDYAREVAREYGAIMRPAMEATSPSEDAEGNWIPPAITDPEEQQAVRTAAHKDASLGVMYALASIPTEAGRIRFTADMAVHVYSRKRPYDGCLYLADDWRKELNPITEVEERVELLATGTGRYMVQYLQLLGKADRIERLELFDEELSIEDAGLSKDDVSIAVDGSIWTRTRQVAGASTIANLKARSQGSKVVASEDISGLADAGMVIVEEESDPDLPFGGDMMALFEDGTTGRVDDLTPGTYQYVSKPVHTWKDGEMVRIKNQAIIFVW